MRPGTSRTYTGVGYWAVQIGFSALLATLGLFGGIFILLESGRPNPTGSAGTGEGAIVLLVGIVFLVLLVWLVLGFLSQSRQQRAGDGQRARSRAEVVKVSPVSGTELDASAVTLRPAASARQRTPIRSSPPPGSPRIANTPSRASAIAGAQRRPAQFQPSDALTASKADGRSKLSSCVDQSLPATSKVSRIVTSWTPSPATDP
ncbi:hypothetical protein BMH32_08400, partial [Leucobacter sp. OLJS4]|uniref:hypothetical protein n=1 Tax=Leucobacter sp. OLJS4 TaxID=1914922 RepID=UPI000C566E58